MFDASKTLHFVEAQWEQEILPSLTEYIKIPNKSPHFDAQWEAHGHMERAVEHIAQWCHAHAPSGMSLQIERIPGRTPLLWMDIPGEKEGTVLLYGHLDKQPEMTGWEAGFGPWQPVLKAGRLYGRGAADDGYAAYAALTAICSLQDQGMSHPRCVVIIEACEESGSYDLPFYIDALKPRLGTPSLVICLDSGAGNYEQLWMTTSLRGNLVGNLSVELLREGVHSGSASGIVADGFRVARSLLSRIEDEETGEICLGALHVEIPEGRIREAGDCASILGDALVRELPFHPKVQPITASLVQLILNRTWRPALTVTGADGMPAIADAGNVMRPKTVLKLSMRIPPTLDPQAAIVALEHALTDAPPYDAKVSFQEEGASKGWNAPKLADWLSKAVDEASSMFFKKPAAYMGEGGTIPFMGMLGEQFPEAQFVITGVLGPHSNAHGPNEFLDLEMAKKVTACVSYILSCTLDLNRKD
ncbi:MAG: M20 family metallopeptidase [Legionellales bacterium]|nr:M20 family metallopeptidase [Legionellales bacterium]